MDAEDYLDSLEPIGWKLGLERMRRLTTLLGMPQHRFDSIHVVGTNGKSSVTRMAMALLEAHGVSAGACVSPHAERWSERVLLHGEEISPEAFDAAVERTAQAAEVVNRSLEAGEEVTQFEVATAAAFVALAAARVKAAVIEAGLGGRLDATNTIPSQVTVLTSVGLDHTQWLGETEVEIAAEKLAVLRHGTTLVLGRVSEEVAELAQRTAEERGARLVRAPEDPGPDVRLRAAGRFQRRNFALARSALEAFLGKLDRGRVAEVAATLAIPGRLEGVAEDPPVLLDAAHNPDGAAAVAESLPELAAGRPVIACLAILRDKDAGATIGALAPALARAVCTEIPPAALAARGLPDAASHSARELADACSVAGLPAEVEPEFATAVSTGCRIARACGGILLITGSHYLLSAARAAIRLCEDS